MVADLFSSLETIDRIDQSVMDIFEDKTVNCLIKMVNLHEYYVDAIFAG